ncbi:membrane protein [Mycobacterium montefiorense]|uniref:Membrane protein n=2 Tax=Mycobacterium montefiorense TaxID=154654 RepID=A0AA37PQF7_9MYCO|nr:membrane protein [Mycobacterium montefiorense]GKU33336.1 membrane protein [Mycobacterium montefiorense]GKU41736.1 membrane protein [Mycobacterium montefiorense]GKU44866.1 membrane protein [Mycobacterium montefiorense]GKU52160.1 membrane protein [Mycobacterium montefiorense]
MSGGHGANERGLRDTRRDDVDLSAGRGLGASATVLYGRARNWWIGSDPGLLRLRMATRTTTALACSLTMLFVLTRATGQPLTVALLGVVITMIASRSVNEPDSRQQRITMALLPLPAALSIIAAAALAPYQVAADTVFVIVVFTAVYIRRFGPRGRALGMVAFMAYFFTLYLRASLSELPWMIGAVVVGTVCTFVMTTYVLPDHPERVLRATIRALRARMAIVVDTTADAVRTGRLDERRQRQMRARTIRLNETALMVQSQIEDKADPAVLWPGVTSQQLAPWLFDAELAIEWVANAGRQAALVVTENPTAIGSGTRLELAGVLTELARAIRIPSLDGLAQAASQAQRILDHQPTPTADDDPGQAAIRRLALAIINAATATAEVRSIIDHATGKAAESIEDAKPAEPEQACPEDDDSADAKQAGGLSQTTRQAIQVTIAASLAIVTGELVSPARWFWAVIAAFVIFAGTNSWGETLTKGWQRMLGTILGVPCGMLAATLFAGAKTASLAAIFVCLFCAFYFMTITYSLMTFWITTMLALLYGLMGQFSFGVLMLRIEETAIGAVIGVTVAILVLPTNTRTAIRDDTLAFLKALTALIEISTATMFGDDEAVSPTEQARQLDRNLQQFRITAKPLLAGVAGLAGRRSIRRGLRIFTACDRYGRSLARSSERYRNPVGSQQLAVEMGNAFTTAAEQTRRNIDALVTLVDGAGPVTVNSTTDALDAAEALARHRDDEAEPPADARRFLTAVHALRQIERAVITAATNLGAHDTQKVASQTAH